MVRRRVGEEEEEKGRVGERRRWDDGDGDGVASRGEEWMGSGLRGGVDGDEDAGTWL